VQRAVTPTSPGPPAFPDANGDVFELPIVAIAERLPKRAAATAPAEPVLARRPYGQRSEPVSEFAFEEDTDGHTGKNYSWMNLIKFCCNGKHIPKGKIIVRKAGQNPLDYVVIELENIIISSISSGATGREDLLVEHVGLNFSKFNYIYTPQNKDGSGAGAIEAPWDIAKNASS